MINLSGIRPLKITLSALAILSIVSCGEGKYGSMTNAELNEKKKHCDSIPQKSAVFANGCEKISEEVKRRKELRKAKRKG